ncbi:MAG: DUF4012 domain-containing protein [Candidatus Moraniibacteriota bacterium]
MDVVKIKKQEQNNENAADKIQYQVFAFGQVIEANEIESESLKQSIAVEKNNQPVIKDVIIPKGNQISSNNEEDNCREEGEAAKAASISEDDFEMVLTNENLEGNRFLLGAKRPVEKRDRVSLKKEKKNYANKQFGNDTFLTNVNLADSSIEDVGLVEVIKNSDREDFVPSKDIYQEVSEFLTISEASRQTVEAANKAKVDENPVMIEVAPAVDVKKEKANIFLEKTQQYLTDKFKKKEAFSIDNVKAKSTVNEVAKKIEIPVEPIIEDVPTRLAEEKELVAEPAISDNLLNNEPEIEVETAIFAKEKKVKEKIKIPKVSVKLFNKDKITALGHKLVGFSANVKNNKNNHSRKIVVKRSLSDDSRLDWLILLAAVKVIFRRLFLEKMILVPATIVLVFFTGVYFQRGMDAKREVLGMSKDAYTNINLAIDGMKGQDFLTSSGKFNAAYENFSEASKSLEKMGKGAIAISRFIPGVSKLSSGYGVTEAGKELSLAGEEISKIASALNELKNNKSSINKDGLSLLEIFTAFEEELESTKKHLIKAQENIDKVKIGDIPKENQVEFIALKNKLPTIIKTVEDFSDNSHLFADFLGANGPRKYLFLFQNNQEMRATGGFIGSYGVLDIDGEGNVRNFFIDGIFNPDGQLLDKIVPPKPVQKVSIAWSLHDSNWFPDFPTSAKKAMLFYERTGGPTVDGVITLTPNVLEKLLDISGPIEMKKYDLVLTKDNFIQNIQYEVEEGYDKSKNRPKEILADLAPLVLDKVLQMRDASSLSRVINVFGEALGEKHVLFYFSNKELQTKVHNLGWSGEVMQTEGDYLSVINTNINGYKTDGVMDEKIKQQIDIDKNGEITKTVSITRKHKGGNTQFEWWNKVNADYMRVYVPRGSVLLQVDGQTREINEDVVDYASLNFEKDTDVENEESQMKIDEGTGTRIYNELDKTVFANWVYVSPQEEVTIKYKYKLPFKLDETSEVNAYSLLTQKQSGSWGSGLDIALNYPKEWKAEWQNTGLSSCVGENQEFSSICFADNLKTDKFMGLVFSK